MAQTEWYVLTRIEDPTHGEVFRKIGSRPVYADTGDAALLVAAGQNELDEGRYLVVPRDMAVLHTLGMKKEYTVV